MPLLWNDRAGRFAPLKCAALILLCLPAVAVALGWATDNLGPKPVSRAIHETGEWTIRFLLATLAISPARKLFSWGKLISVRRMLGVGTMVYAVAHLCLYTLQQQGNLLIVASEIALRFYLTIGFLALLGLIALGWTSTDGWVKRLGSKRWQNLHLLAYPIGCLALWHYALQLKIDVSKAVVLTGFFLWLMGYRLLQKRRWPVNGATLLGLSIVCALATAAIEALWYQVHTGIPAMRILFANVNFHIALRPAWWVLVVGLAVSLAVFAWQRFFAAPGALARPVRAG